MRRDASVSLEEGRDEAERETHLRVDDAEVDHRGRVELGMVCIRERSTKVSTSRRWEDGRKEGRTSRRLGEEDLGEDARDDRPELEELQRHEREAREHDVRHKAARARQDVSSSPRKSARERLPDYSRRRTGMRTHK